METKSIDINEYSSLQDIEALAAEQGIRFTKADYKNIRKAQNEARQQLALDKQAEQEQQGSTWADRFMQWYPKLLGSIASAGNIVITFTQSLIVNLGAPIVLVLLLIVEQQRVLHGMMLFESSIGLASFGAWALVIVNLALEVIAHHIEYQHGYISERSKRWSLRIFMNNLGYRFGIGKDWKEQELSPAQWAHGALRIVTITILALALAGSMTSVIQQTSGAWYMAILAIVTESSLLDMFTWIGGLLFAATAVISAQRLSRYIAIRTVEVRAEMLGDNSDDSEIIEQASATAAYAILVDKIKKQQAKAEGIDPVNFIAVPINKQPEMMSTNGNGNGHH